MEHSEPLAEKDKNENQTHAVQLFTVRKLVLFRSD